MSSKHRSARELPSVTIVVPSYDRPRRLQDCVRALARLDYPTDRLTIEIIDDGSREPLAPATEAIECPFPLRVTRQANQGPAAARNAGVRRAAGDLIAFTDDDCAPEPDWLKALARAYSEAPEALIGGRVINGVPGNIYSEASQSLVDYLYRYYDASGGGAPFFTSNNMACARELFLELGGFDTSFTLAAGEDREIGMRWRRRGRPLIYAHEAVVHHFHVLSLRKFWRQHSNYGRGARHLHRVLAAGNHEQPRLEDASFYRRLLLHPFETRRIAGLPQAGLMMLSQVAMIAGFVRGGR